MQITFKSGAQIMVDVAECSSRGRAGGGIGDLRWDTPENWRAKLVNFDINEVVAVVVTK